MQLFLMETQETERFLFDLYLEHTISLAGFQGPFNDSFLKNIPNPTDRVIANL